MLLSARGGLLYVGRHLRFRTLVAPFVAVAAGARTRPGGFGSDVGPRRRATTTTTTTTIAAPVRATTTTTTKTVEDGAAQRDDDDDPETLEGYDDLPPNVVWPDAVGLGSLPAAADGSGVTVAVLDTGVTRVPELGDRVLARVDLTPEGDGYDRYGHGTHMTGIIAGDGDSAEGAWRGVAPGVERGVGEGRRVERRDGRHRGDRRPRVGGGPPGGVRHPRRQHLVRD